MTVKELKGILNKIADDLEVVIVHAEWLLKKIEVDDKNSKVKLK